MTDRNDAAIAALQYERAGYARSGKADRVKQVDAELAKLGVKPVDEPVERKTRPRREA